MHDQINRYLFFNGILFTAKTISVSGGLKGAVLPSELDNKGFEKEDDSLPATFEPKPPIQEHQYDTRF